MTKTIDSWAADAPIRSPFAYPEGLLGRLAGLYMRWSFEPAPLLAALDVRPGDRALEIGFGPGTLLDAQTWAELQDDRPVLFPARKSAAGKKFAGKIAALTRNSNDTGLTRRVKQMLAEYEKR